MRPMNVSGLDDLFKKYISGKRILIVDGAASSRSGLFTTFQWMGAKTNQIVLASTFNQAQELIPSVQPHIVVSEYNLGNRCGLELLQKQREQRPDETKNCLFILVTGNTTQSAVAHAVEEDIDAYILKPLIPMNVSQTILRAAALKLRPSEYQQAIERGKNALKLGNIDEADNHFIQATSLDPSPTLAHYYQGYTDTIRSNVDQAKSDFQNGLKYNNIHYKCLIGLYDAFRQQGDHQQAYDVVRKIAHYFPANPKRMEEVLRLAIITGHFSDIDEYYKLFITIEDRNDSLIRYVCSALVVCGKHYLARSDLTKANNLFEKAAISGVRRWNILLEIVASLVEYKHSSSATKFLNRFPPESCESDEFLLANFLVSSTGQDPGPTLMLGHSLLRKGVQDLRLYLVMLEKYYQAKLIPSAEDLACSAKKAFPEACAKIEKIQRAAQLQGQKG